MLSVVEAAIKRRVPSKLEADLIGAQREFRCLAWGFESNGAFEHSRQTFIRSGEAQGVPMPLVGIPATVAPEVRIDSLEPFVTDPMLPRILFAPYLTQLLAELDSWPEPQTGHHYDGLCGLWLLVQVAMRGIGRVDVSTRAAARDRDVDDLARAWQIDLRGYGA